MIEDWDTLLASNINFIFGIWQASAQAYATNSVDAALLEYNARNQITLWGKKSFHFIQSAVVLLFLVKQICVQVMFVFFKVR